MNRLEQDAADALQAYEDRRKAWGERAKADLARFNAQPIGKTWAPFHTEQQKQEQAQYIQQHGCKF